MTAWALLLIAMMLLDTPGLRGDDPAPAYLCDGDPLCQYLVQEGLQGDLLTKSERVHIACSPCKTIIQHLKNLVGAKPTQDIIMHAASQVCGSMWLLKIPCMYIMKHFLGRISQDILNSKDARDICVDIRMCRPKAAKYRGLKEIVYEGLVTTDILWDSDIQKTSESSSDSNAPAEPRSLDPGAGHILSPGRPRRPASYCFAILLGREGSLRLLLQGLQDSWGNRPHC